MPPQNESSLDPDAVSWWETAESPNETSFRKAMRPGDNNRISPPRLMAKRYPQYSGGNGEGVQSPESDDNDIGSSDWKDENIFECDTKPKKFLEWFDGIQDRSQHEDTHHFVIILEGLSYEWVQALGLRLQVPLSVFATHWAKPDDYMLGKHRPWIGNPVEQHFVMSYRQILPLSIREKSTKFRYFLNYDAIRVIDSDPGDPKSVPDDPKSVPGDPKSVDNKPGLRQETCEQLVSYYGCKTQSKWIALILVDPSVPSPEFEDGRLKRLVKRMPFNVHRTDNVASDPSKNTKFAEVYSDPRVQQIFRLYSSLDISNSIKDKSTSHISSHGKFDASGVLYAIFGKSLFPQNEALNASPVSATYEVRRIILARTALVVHSMLKETLDLTLKAAVNLHDLSDFNFDKFDHRAWTDQWRAGWFRCLWELRENLELFGYKMNMNKKVAKKIMHLNSRNIRDRKKMKSKYLRDRKEDIYSQQQEEDLSAWNDLTDLFQYTFKVMDRSTDSYLQTVQATQAQLANVQAKGVNNITKIAGLFAPASLCATLLALPWLWPDGADPKRLWIFAAVSVPLALLTFLLFMTPLSSYWKKRLEDYADIRNQQPNEFDWLPLQVLKKIGANIAHRYERSTNTETDLSTSGPPGYESSKSSTETSASISAESVRSGVA